MTLAVGRAISSYRLAIQFHPNSGIAYNALGRVLSRLIENDEEAECCLERAIVLNAYDNNTYVELGNILMRKQKIDAALAKFRYAQKRIKSLCGAKPPQKPRWTNAGRWAAVSAMEILPRTLGAWADDRGVSQGGLRGTTVYRGRKRRFRDDRQASSGAKLGHRLRVATGDLRGVLRRAGARPGAVVGLAADHGAMACRGVSCETVRMKTNRPW